MEEEKENIREANSWLRGIWIAAPILVAAITFLLTSYFTRLEALEVQLDSMQQTNETVMQDILQRISRLEATIEK